MYLYIYTFILYLFDFYIQHHIHIYNMYVCIFIYILAGHRSSWSQLISWSASLVFRFSNKLNWATEVPDGCRCWKGAWNDEVTVVFQTSGLWTLRSCVERLVYIKKQQGNLIIIFSIARRNCPTVNEAPVQHSNHLAMVLNFFGGVFRWRNLCQSDLSDPRTAHGKPRHWNDSGIWQNPSESWANNCLQFRQFPMIVSVFFCQFVTDVLGYIQDSIRFVPWNIVIPQAQHIHTMGQNGSRPIPYFCHAWKKSRYYTAVHYFHFFPGWGEQNQCWLGKQIYYISG